MSRGKSISRPKLMSRVGEVADRIGAPSLIFKFASRMPLNDLHAIIESIERETEGRVPPARPEAPNDRDLLADSATQMRVLARTFRAARSATYRLPDVPDVGESGTREVSAAAETTAERERRLARARGK